MNYTEANDAIQTMFLAGFQTQAAALTGYPVQIIWPWSVGKENAPTNKAWARLTRKSFGSELSGPASDEGNPAKRRYDENAALIIQLFVPRSEQRTQIMPMLGDIAKKALQGKADPTNWLWIGDVTFNELDAEESWHRANVVAMFTYQELRG